MDPTIWDIHALGNPRVETQFGSVAAGTQYTTTRTVPQNTYWLLWAFTNTTVLQGANSYSWATFNINDRPINFESMSHGLAGMPVSMLRFFPVLVPPGTVITGTCASSVNGNWTGNMSIMYYEVKL